MSSESRKPIEVEVEAKARSEWTRPNMRLVAARDAEIGLISPSPEGTFGLS